MERTAAPPVPLAKEPNCQKCDGLMRFACTETDKPDFVHHVFECRKCRSTQSFVTPVEDAPSKLQPAPAPQSAACTLIVRRPMRFKSRDRTARPRHSARRLRRTE